jgi:hypothetical protein
MGGLSSVPPPTRLPARGAPGESGVEHLTVLVTLPVFRAPAGWGAISSPRARQSRHHSRAWSGPCAGQLASTKATDQAAARGRIATQSLDKRRASFEGGGLHVAESTRGQSRGRLRRRNRARSRQCARRRTEAGPGRSGDRPLWPESRVRTMSPGAAKTTCPQKKTCQFQGIENMPTHPSHHSPRPRRRGSVVWQGAVVVGGPSGRRPVVGERRRRGGVVVEGRRAAGSCCTHPTHLRARGGVGGGVVAGSLQGSSWQVSS